MDDVTCSCDKPTCEHSVLYLHSRCHPDSPTWVRYVKGSGELEVLCAECRTCFVKILVGYTAAV